MGLISNNFLSDKPRLCPEMDSDPEQAQQHRRCVSGIVPALEPLAGAPVSPP